MKYASLALASVVCLVALCSTLRVLHPKLETQAAAKAAGVHIRKRLIFQFTIQKTPLVEKFFPRLFKSKTFMQDPLILLKRSKTFAMTKYNHNCFAF